MSGLRILIADDHEVVRAGVRGLLANRPGWQVCAEAGSGREAVAQAEQHRPDLVIMDVSMPDGNGLEATKQIRERVPGCEVLVLSIHESNQLIREIVAAGARGYVLKTDAGRELMQAVETVSQHQPYFTSRASAALLPKPAAEKAALTPREREIVALVALGKMSKEIAAELGISPLTVETHRNNAMHKLNLHSVADLVRYAVREGLIVP
jgi:DNA-binding NarL/FixJ family response regulator